MRIGVVGLGAMGSPIAHRLLDAGYDVVVHNRTAGRTGPLIDRGAEPADSPADLAAAVDVVVSCVLDDAAVEQVHLGQRGVLDGTRPGLLVVEHATFSPALAGRLEAAYRGAGAGFLDAPISGGPERAASGDLVAMVGGDQDDVGRARPLLSSYCSKVVHVGGPATGLQLKLVNQLLVVVHASAAADALALLGRLGIRPDAASDVLLHGWAASTMLDRALTRRETQSAGPSGATIEGLLEPAALAHDLLMGQGLGSGLLLAARDMLVAATRSGHGAADIGDLLLLHEELV